MKNTPPKTVLLVHKKGQKFTPNQIEEINKHHSAGGLVATRERCDAKLPDFEYLVMPSG